MMGYPRDLRTESSKTAQPFSRNKSGRNPRRALYAPDPSPPAVESSAASFNPYCCIQELITNSIWARSFATRSLPVALMGRRRDRWPR